MTYTYNLSGTMVEQVYPSGRVVKNTLKSGGELSAVQSKKNGSLGYWNYADNITYNTAGAVTSMQLGNGRWQSAAFNSRMQPTRIALSKTPGATDLLQLDYTYGTWEGSTTLNLQKNNGNIAKQELTVPTVGSNPGFFAMQLYAYDPLNRISQATELINAGVTWQQTFSYDRYGNRNFNESATTTLPKNCSGAVCPADRKLFNPSISAASNRLNTDQDGDSIADYTFDNSGNTTKMANGLTFTYDAENKQIEVKNSSNVTIGQYWYDGNGQRVKKYVPGTGETTIFVYDAAGKAVAEYSTLLNPTPQVSYLTADHLGSPRINTDQNGAVVSRHDYRPFGEEIATSQRTAALGYAADNNRKQFTGYERDKETGLDFAQARMYGGNFGRFTSVDPAASRIAAPQSHNKYVYVENNPLNSTDPTGETLVINGENANALMDELEQSTGYKLKRCLAVDKKAGCSEVGQVLIDKSRERTKGTGTSTKLADELKRVIENLTDANGKDVTVTMNTAKGDPKKWIDQFHSRTVDVGEMQQLRGAGAASFLAGQLGHVLAEYAAAAVNKANNPGYVDEDGEGNPKTHDTGLAMETAIMSEMDKDSYQTRRGGTPPDVEKGQKEIVYIYDNGTDRKAYIFRLDLDSNRKIIYNITQTIELRTVPSRGVPK
jgi:RHS repeat-associated protein